MNNIPFSKAVFIKYYNADPKYQPKSFVSGYVKLAIAVNGCSTALSTLTYLRYKNC